MLIKKKKRNNSEDDNNDIQSTLEVQPQEEIIEAKKHDESLFSAFQNIADRQERRRGDRRRGYRRVDDRNLISRAQEEANLIRENAIKEGFQVGLEKAKADIKNLKSAIISLVNVKEEAFSGYTNDIAFIAIKAAEKIIKTEVACDETIVLNIISEVLKDIGKDESRIIIKVNPQDTSFVSEKIPDVLPSAFSQIKLYVEDDTSVDQGSCVVQTTSGQIDARFSIQMELLQKAFEAEWQGI